LAVVSFYGLGEREGEGKKEEEGKRKIGWFDHVAEEGLGERGIEKSFF